MPPLTIIVATTKSMGMGRAGALPWPMLKSEMAYFARVTKRVPPTSPSPDTMNAVVMGRKTWESIPPSFRPLTGRINVVISRTGIAEIETADHGSGHHEKSVYVAGGLDEALRILTHSYPSSPPNTNVQGPSRKTRLGHIFVLGGAEIYRMALGGGRGGNLDEQRPHSWVVQRILWTRIQTEFDCDTFFPIDLDALSTGTSTGWIRKTPEELEGWTGQKGIAQTKVENGVEFDICMLEREEGPPGN